MTDIVVIGGSIVGSSVAYHMAMAGHAAEVCVIEPDPNYAWAAAPRSAGGVRLMYGLPENIEMSRYGREVFLDFARLMDVDGQPGIFPYRRHGYLYLATGRPKVRGLETSFAVQTGQGVANELLDRDALAERFPFLRTDDVDAGLFGPDDGTIDPHAALTGIRRKAESLGVRYVKDKVTGLEVCGSRVARVALASGRSMKVDAVVNVAGAWAPAICAMVGMDVPVEPLSRPTFHFDAARPVGEVPLTKDSSGVMFRNEGAGYATGLTPADAKGGFQWEVQQSDYDQFESVIWPALAHRVPAFEQIKLRRAWAGHYAMNWFDGNAIIGSWSGRVDNFFFALGFSGAGLQKAPAIGRALTELITEGGYQTIDLTRLSYQRVLDNEPLVETGFKA
ncbi:MAG: FAD-dependent oxidoreductase [Pseudomonadota bacterium]